MEKRNKNDTFSTKFSSSLSTKETAKISFCNEEKKPKKKSSNLNPLWKQSSLPINPEVKKFSKANLSKQGNETNKNFILPTIGIKDRPFSEDNVTHQISDLTSINKDKFMASISNNRELSSLRKKINPIHSQTILFTDDLKNVKDPQKIEKNEKILKTILDPIQNKIPEPKKSYVEKIRHGLIQAKKFDNPVLYEMVKKENANELEKSEENIPEEEIKDEFNITINSSEKSMSKNNNEFKKISEKNSKSSSFRSSGSCHKKENKMLLFTKSNQSSSNSEELLEMQRKIKRETDSNEFSSDSFKSEIYGNILKWKLGDLIDSGSFAQVYRAMDCNTGKIFAVKKFNLTLPGVMEEESLKDIEAELEILKKIKHENIVRYHGHEKINGNFYIYLEYIPGGNLSAIISKYGPLREAVIKHYARQLLSGLEYLHENKIVHKDIKGANILVDDNGIVKLSDFGCSKIIEKTLTLYFNENKNHGIQGSIPWMAPEVVKQTKYGRKSDVWSFGCTILEMITGKPPWCGYKFDNPVAAIMKIGLSEEIPEIPEGISAKLKDFLLGCLQRDPEQRMTVKDLLLHPFLKS